MFAEKGFSDCLFRWWFQCQCLLRFSRCQSTAATWSAEKTSGKTVFAKPDWDKLMEQWNSGNRAAAAVVSGVLFQVY